MMLVISVEDLPFIFGSLTMSILTPTHGNRTRPATSYVLVEVTSLYKYYVELIDFQSPSL